MKDNRRQLRNNLTPAEAKLWALIKNSELDGRKFRRQHSIGNYILDFYCPAEKLAVELDGAYHFSDTGMEYDEERTKYLNSLNIRVVRFENKAVLEQAAEVLQRIREVFCPPAK